jgi:hypothetical protein
MTTVGRNSLADIEYAKSMDVWDISPYSQIQNSSSLVFKTPKNDRYRLRINSFQVRIELHNNCTLDQRDESLCSQWIIWDIIE